MATPPARPLVELSWREHLEYVRQRRPFGAPDGSYRSHVIYLAGFDAGTRGALLSGFREWLIPRADRGNNLVWSGLVLLIAFPDREQARHDLDDEDNTAAVTTLYDLLETFLTDRDGGLDGLHRIHVAYEEWLQRRRSQAGLGR